jgi:predicted aspartyl protease
MNKNSIGLDIVYVEPCKNNIDWATPFFSDEYVHQKVRIIDNLDFIKNMSNKIKIVDRRLVMDVKIYDTSLNSSKIYNALIDTGSQETLISNKVVNDLKLISNGKTVSINNTNSSLLYDCVLNFTTSSKAYPIECAIHNISKYDIIIGVNILELVETHIEGIRLQKINRDELDQINASGVQVNRPTVKEETNCKSIELVDHFS